MTAAAIRSIAADPAVLEELVQIQDALVTALKRGGKVLLCGNGGSAADAQHLAGEFVGRFLKERSALPAVALHTNTSTLTAIGNDYGFDQVFARQVEALGSAGDVLIGLSTSGNSANVLQAVEQAKRREIMTVGFTGRGGGKLAEIADLCFRAPADETPTIQECHITVGHLLCQLVEDRLFPSTDQPE